MWKRKRKASAAPQPRKAVGEHNIPAAEIIEGWAQNPMNVMPNWPEVRRQAAFALTDETTRGFVLLRVHNGGLKGNRDQVLVDLCLMPYQRQAVKDSLESLASQLS